jgi:nucleotide-binding universal stress UspA family protein
MSQEDTSINRILVGVDGSEGSCAALSWASRLAEAAGAEVVVVHVIEPPEYDLRALGLPRAILNEADWREAVRKEMEGTWCRALVASGVRHRTRIEEGRPGPLLAAIAHEEHADLLVTGSRGLRGFAELIQGSVSAYVTHHARCPVAVVPTRRQAA